MKYAIQNSKAISTTTELPKERIKQTVEIQFESQVPSKGKIMLIQISMHPHKVVTPLVTELVYIELICIESFVLCLFVINFVIM